MATQNYSHPFHTAAANQPTTTDRLLAEGIATVVEAATAEGIQITAKTALRWVIHGVRGVRLESIKVAGRRMTSRQAIRRFVANTQNEQGVSPEVDPAVSEHVLKSHGLGR